MQRGAAFHVQSCRRFVQKEDFRVSEKGRFSEILTAASASGQRAVLLAGDFVYAKHPEHCSIHCSLFPARKQSDRFHCPDVFRQAGGLELHAPFRPDGNAAAIAGQQTFHTRQGRGLARAVRAQQGKISACTQADAF